MTQTQQRSILIATSVAAFLSAFMGSSLNIALPAISAEFAMNAILLSWTPTAFTLAAAMLLVPLGRLADIHGRKRVFILGLLVSALSYLLAVIVRSGEALIGVRVVQGAGAAMLFATSTAILTSSFPPGQRGRALGINVASVYIGLSIGPFIGGVLTQNFGWRSIFLLGTALAAVAALLAWRIEGEWAEARGEPFDLAGALIYGAAVALGMYGLSRLPGFDGAALMLAGAAGLAGFVAWERRAAKPLLNVDLFRYNRVFALSSLAALINYAATTAVGFLLSLYLQYVRGLSPQGAGLVLAAQPIMQALFSPAAGRLSDRIESRIVASAGMAMTAAGLLLLIFVGPATPLWYIIGSLLLLGFGFALFSSPNTNAVMSSVTRRDYGVASATLGTMRLLGQMASLGVAMLLFALFIGPVQITPEVYPAFLAAMRTAFILFSALCVAGVFASLARGNVRNGAPAAEVTESAEKQM
jgi:EmrB/QacA subfamily drug resistance transporter